MGLPVHSTSQAQVDVIEAADFLARDDLEVAERFLDAIDFAQSQIQQNSFIGSPFPTSKHPDLRRWSVRGFRIYQIFYRLMADHISIVRVLHGARDLPTALDK